MQYNDEKKEFLQTIDTLIKSQKGKTFKIIDLEKTFGIKYGFGKLTILRALKPYEANGEIICYYEDDNKKKSVQSFEVQE